MPRTAYYSQSEIDNGMGTSFWRATDGSIVEVTGTHLRDQPNRPPDAKVVAIVTQFVRYGQRRTNWGEPAAERRSRPWFEVDQHSVLSRRSRPFRW